MYCGLLRRLIFSLNVPSLSFFSQKISRLPVPESTPDDRAGSRSGGPLPRELVGGELRPLERFLIQRCLTLKGRHTSSALLNVVLRWRKRIRKRETRTFFLAEKSFCICHYTIENEPSKESQEAAPI